MVCRCDALIIHDNQAQLGTLSRIDHSSGCLPVSCRSGPPDMICCVCEPLATPTQGCSNPACVSGLCCGLVTNTVKKTAKKLDM